MDYVGSVYRPPSEADSLLLQVTVGCSHNACTYCAMYLEKRFRAKSWEVIERDIREAAEIGPRFHRVFLCDGDALILSADRLRTILRAIRDRLGWVRRVSVYGDTRSVLRKSVEELTELRELGLGMVYHGVESGDDDVLRFVRKGGTCAEIVETAQRLREAGIAHSVIVMLGVGGVEGGQKHARETASLLSEIDPPYVGVLTTTLVPGTPLYEASRAGTFKLPSKFEMLRELLTIVEHAQLSNCRFSSNHASNYLPVRCTMPRDRDRVVGVLRDVVAAGDESMLRPEGSRGL
ncbi:MAG: radical SAM protein [Deltaproteobacteria bacterium HGW-Deltaproteobacteria-20]|nr:MAG: radical SAM protein [Deltaproteobacteria bacterium HGW-Deltaproteobacteria-20]